MGGGRMKHPSQKQLQAQVDKFNAEYPVGSHVNVTMDDGANVATVVSRAAMILGGHSAVAWFKDIAGCYRLDRAVKSQ